MNGLQINDIRALINISHNRSNKNALMLKLYFFTHSLS